MNKKLLLLPLLFLYYFSTAQTYEIGYKEYYSLAGYGLDIVRDEINNSTEKITPDFILRYRNGEAVYIKTENLEPYDARNASSSKEKTNFPKVSYRYKNHKTKEYILHYINYKSSLYGKDITVKDTLSTYNWNLSEKTENIFGYNCKSATALNKSGTKVLVWYTDEVLIQGGPREYWGLPGLIVQVEIDDRVLIFTTHVTQLDHHPEIYKPFMENTISREEFTALKEEIYRPRTITLKDGTEINVTNEKGDRTNITKENKQ